jgi:hypothetical protein
MKIWILLSWIRMCHKNIVSMKERCVMDPNKMN